MAEKIKINFLGTGAVTPTARRNHPAVLLTYKDENILFDCGEGTQRQFRKAKINPCRLTKILISHWHADHVLGLPGLLQTLMLNGYNRKLIIYGPLGTKKMMRLYMDLFVSKAGKIDLDVHEIDEGAFFEGDEFILESKKLDHDTLSLGFSFNLRSKMRIDTKKLEKLKVPNGPLLGKLAKGETIELNGKKIDGDKLLYKEEGRRVVYIPDTRFFDGLIDFAKDSNVLISESTYTDQEAELAKDHAHMTCTQAAEIAKGAKVKKLFLFHLSQRYEDIPRVLEKQAQAVFEESKVAEDLDSFVL
jgi:ribonuclease Z